MKAIETRYNGFRFRSRLEAKWAMLFDLFGVPYEYEREGFKMGNVGWYLPDFWIPAKYHKNVSHPAFEREESGYWIEIKGRSPTPEEIEKCSILSRDSQHITEILIGGFGSNFGQIMSFDIHGRITVRGCLNPASHIDALSIVLDCKDPYPNLSPWQKYEIVKSHRFDRRAA